jgi:DNA anti-recombination protein RmuC
VTAAYEARPNLFYDAARDGVLIAGPATLLSILWGVAHGLQQDARARHGREIGQSAVELHRRLGALVPDLRKLGSFLGMAVTRYNGLLASLGRQGAAAGAEARRPWDLCAGDRTARRHSP